MYHVHVWYHRLWPSSRQSQLVTDCSARQTSNSRKMPPLPSWKHSPAADATFQHIRRFCMDPDTPSVMVVEHLPWAKFTQYFNFGCAWNCCARPMMGSISWLRDSNLPIFWNCVLSEWSSCSSSATSTHCCQTCLAPWILLHSMPIFVSKFWIRCSVVGAYRLMFWLRLGMIYRALCWVEGFCSTLYSSSSKLSSSKSFRKCRPCVQIEIHHLCIENFVRPLDGFIQWTDRTYWVCQSIQYNVHRVFEAGNFSLQVQKHNVVNEICFASIHIVFLSVVIPGLSNLETENASILSSEVKTCRLSLGGGTLAGLGVSLRPEETGTQHYTYKASHPESGKKLSEYVSAIDYQSCQWTPANVPITPGRLIHMLYLKPSGATEHDSYWELLHDR